VLSSDGKLKQHIGLCQEPPSYVSALKAIYSADVIHMYVDKYVHTKVSTIFVEENALGYFLCFVYFKQRRYHYIDHNAGV
jgi:hypothetical protein